MTDALETFGGAPASDQGLIESLKRPKPEPSRLLGLRGVGLAAVLAVCLWLALRGGSGGGGAAAGEQTATACIKGDGAGANCVDTPLGTVRGVVGGRNAVTREFLGIPFAKPPRRWLPPEPAEPWPGVLDATSYRPNCASGAEDCLALNVHAPLADCDGCKPASGFPVMVYFHGGCFVGGAPEYYNMAGLVEDALDDGEGAGVIGVSVSFRVGVLGHLASTSLKERNVDGRSSAGNWGIQDQRQALRWGKGSIAAFGGAPARAPAPASLSGPV